MITLGLIALGHVACGAILVGFLPVPNSAALPYLGASTLVHWAGYIGPVPTELSRHAIFAALAIGGLVVMYMLIDGIGVRVSGRAFGYIGWLFIVKLLIVLFLFPSRWDRLRATPPWALLVGFLGGVVSASAYAWWGDRSAA